LTIYTISIVSLSMIEAILVFPEYLKKLINVPFLIPKVRQL